MARLHVRQRGRGWVYVIERGKYPAGHPKEGKRWQEWSKQFPSADDAQMAGARRLLEVGQATSDPAKITLAEWLHEWLDSQHHLADNTRSVYAGIIRHHIVPPLGTVLLADLSARMIQRWQAGLLDTLAPSSAGAVRKVLDTALNHAVKMDVLTRNPSAPIRKPTTTKKRKVVWSEAEVVKVLSLTTDTQQRLALRLMATTGMRVSELLALRWEDIEDGALVIRQHVRYANGERVLVEGRKGKGGERRIELDDTTSTLLRQWSVEQKRLRLRSPMWRDQGYVMTSRQARGGIMGRMLSDTAVDQWVRSAARRAGVIELSPHGLRHTWATIALTNGVPLTVVSERLGHADPSITLRVYAHLLPSADRLAADLMDTLYGDTEKHDGQRSG